MTWANFYLVCFLIGFLFSLVSLLLGSVHFHFHIPHVGGHGLNVHIGHGAGHGGGHVGHGGGNAVEAQVSPLNVGSMAAFLAWFGGAGYLMTRYSGFWSMLALGVAVCFGVFGAGVVFWFLLKLSAYDKCLDPSDYEMVGVLGYISSGIRAGGTGEIIYSQDGTRHTCGARSEDGSQIEKGTEIVVTRYDKGIAYVRRWEELAGEPSSADAATGAK